MPPLHVIPVTLIPRTPDEARALRAANGADLAAEHATQGALLAFTSVLLALVVTLLAGCSSFRSPELAAAGKAAQAVACAICDEGAPVDQQAEAHARALRDIFEAVTALAAAVDRAEAERIRDELRASQAREKELAGRLLQLAASAAPVAPAPAVAP